MGGGNAGIIWCGEDVAVDGGEHAGGVIGDDTAPVVVGGQGEPAEFVEVVDVGTCDVDDAVERAACGDFGDNAGDIRGGDRLDWPAPR